VRRAEASIRAEIRCRRHSASRCRRSYDFALLNKRSVKLYTYLKPNAAVPIDSDLAAAFRSLRTQCVPD
jgi:hypothetical protein